MPCRLEHLGGVSGGTRGPPEAPCAAPQCGNGAPALLVSTSTDFPINLRLIRGQIWRDLEEYIQIDPPTIRKLQPDRSY